MNQEQYSANILIVDDQMPNVRLLQKILSGAGYINVIITTNPLEVEELHKEYNFDLVLLDIRMPKMDGFQVMEKLKEIEQDNYVPVLVLTAQNDDATKLDALRAGAKDFLVKPFDQNEVLLRISNMLEVRLLHKQTRNQNKILDQRVNERTKELNDTRLEIIRRLGRAAEFRDNETGFHIIRMSKFSRLIAIRSGMNEEQSELILNASPMHDIGKIGIPDRILLKPGKLDAQEWKIMQTHAAIGADILSGHDSELMTMAKEIAISHHEKWDGSGYPNGLAGEQIPLSGRIVAVSDVFDALTSERPYKKAWPVEEAIEEIKRGAGLHFDPDLVEVFLQVLPEILDVRGRYVEEDVHFDKMRVYLTGTGTS